MITHLSALVGIGALAAIGPARAAQSGEEETLIRHGIELRKAQDDLAARAEFQKAYDLTHSPRAAAQLGLAEFALGRWDDAEGHVSEALRAPKDPWIAKYRAELDRSLATIKAHVARIRDRRRAGGRGDHHQRSRGWSAPAWYPGFGQRRPGGRRAARAGLCAEQPNGDRVGRAISATGDPAGARGKRPKRDRCGGGRTCAGYGEWARVRRGVGPVRWGAPASTRGGPGSGLTAASSAGSDASGIRAGAPAAGAGASGTGSGGPAVGVAVSGDSSDSSSSAASAREQRRCSRAPEGRPAVDPGGGGPSTGRLVAKWTSLGLVGAALAVGIGATVVHENNTTIFGQLHADAGGCFDNGGRAVDSDGNSVPECEPPLNAYRSRHIWQVVGFEARVSPSPGWYWR